MRSGDIHHPWPEEINRRIIGTIAALHCAPTATAAEALRRENVDPATVHVTGNTVIDALHWVSGRIAAEPALAAGLAELERRFAGKRIVAVTSHRRENFGEGMLAIAQAVLSWVNPYSPVAPLLNAMARPFLRPFQRWVPPVANVDLSPLFVIIACQLMLMLPVAYLESTLTRLL